MNTQSLAIWKRGPLCLACLLLLLGTGCVGLRGERWEVRAKQWLSRASVSVRPVSEGNTLTVLLTVAPSPGEEAHVLDLYLTRPDITVGELAAPPRLPPNEVERASGYGGSIGLGFVYSSGDTERYVGRYSEGGYSAPAGPPGPERLRAVWTLTGPWAAARDLELVVVAVLGTYPHGDTRTEEARFLLIRPIRPASSQAEPASLR